MRKIFVALVVGAVVVWLAAPTFAADLKFTGAYRVRFQFDEGHPTFSRQNVGALETDDNGHQFQTRLKPMFTVETEGGVRGVINLEIGDVRFGNAGSVLTTTTAGTNVSNTGSGSGGGHSADGVNVETKWAYIDFPVPATPLRLRAGIQPFFLSKGLFLDDDGSGLSLYGKVGEINANAFWIRGNGGAGGNTTTGGSFRDQFDNAATIGGVGFQPKNGKSAGSEGAAARDLYGLDLSMSPMKDLNLNVYFVYDHDMETTTGTPPESTTGVWIGAAAAGKVQNIRWDADFVYGSKETPHPISGLKVDQKGWMVDGGVGMALPGTPLDIEVRGWWATGWDGTTTGDIDAFPMLWAGSGSHNTGSQIWTGAAVIDINDIADNPQNTWGIGLLARYTATPALRLTANVHYIGTQEEGTATQPSPVGGGFIFGVDSVGTDIGLRADYTIARGLIFTLTASHLFLGDDTSTDGVRFDDITKVAGVLNYGF